MTVDDGDPVGTDTDAAALTGHFPAECEYDDQHLIQYRLWVNVPQIQIDAQIETLVNLPFLAFRLKDSRNILKFLFLAPKR